MLVRGGPLLEGAPDNRLVFESLRISGDDFMMAFVVLVAAALILGAWSAGVVFTTVWSVPRADLRRFKSVLVVFPHPDDETISCGGTLNRLSRAGSAVSVLLLTRGERGNARGTFDPALGEIRNAEALRAADILGVTSLIHEDLGDGRLNGRRADVRGRIADGIEAIKPDLLITYDLAGLDGHPDHVVCAELVTELRRTQFPHIALWYVSQPGRLVHLLHVVGQLATDAEVDRRRAEPTERVFIGAGVIPKIRAWYEYRSQRAFIARGLGRLVPTWLAVSMLQFEYFAEMV
jgi:LmbE family N-acetylglucosaminyl deacetylase